MVEKQQDLLSTESDDPMEFLPAPRQGPRDLGVSFLLPSSVAGPAPSALPPALLSQRVRGPPARAGLTGCSSG